MTKKNTDPTLELKRKLLVEALHAAAQPVGGATTLPILGHVLMESDFSASEVRLKGTNLDISVTVTMPVSGMDPESDFAVAVPARKLQSIVRELSGDTVRLTVDREKSTTRIESGTSRFTINGLSSAEFPPVPLVPKTNELALPEATFRRALRLTSYAMSEDTTRYILNGLCFHMKSSERQLRLVATDGRRLAMHTQSLDQRVNDGQLLFPSQAVKVVQALTKRDGVARVRWNDSHVEVLLLPQDDEKGEPLTISIVAKQVEGAYPNYLQVLPSDPGKPIEFNIEPLRAAIARAKLMTSEKSAAVKLEFDTDLLTISSCTPEVGSAKESLPLIWPHKAQAVALNPEYLLSVLESMQSSGASEVKVGVIDELSPISLTLGDEVRCVIMPMRFN
ncbi:MAG: DNA polymerase III subunit beta [Limisphaerales bacterium]